MKLRSMALFAILALALSGCHYTAGESYLPGENFGKGGTRCGTANTHAPTKQWGCIYKK